MVSGPSFSICIPNYNYGRFIGETIETVLNQEYQDFEIVVVDNKSTDNSVEVVRGYMEKDARIRLFENRYNVGFAPNLQYATQHATKDFVTLLSSDDQMKPGALAAYAEVIGELGPRSERAVLFSDVDMFDEHGLTGQTEKAPDGHYLSVTRPFRAEAPSTGKLPYTLYSGHEVLRDALKRLRTFAPFLAMTYSRQLWQDVEGYNAIRTIGPDKFFGYKILGLDPTVAYVRRRLFRYRDYVSDNRAVQTTTLKQPIDDYLYTLEMRASNLDPLGLTSDDLIRTFIEDKCITEGWRQFGYGNSAHAFKLLAFAVAAYPDVVLKNPKAYALVGALGAGRLLPGLGPKALELFKRRRGASRAS